MGLLGGLKEQIDRVESPEEEMGHASLMPKSPFYCSKAISHSLWFTKSRTNLLEAMNQHWSSNSRENFSCPKTKIPQFSGDVAPGLGSFSVSALPSVMLRGILQSKQPPGKQPACE